MSNNFSRRLAVFFVFACVFASAARAAEPVVWETDSRAEVLRGDARNVSITDTGAIILAPQLREVYNTQQSFVWSSAVDQSGNVFLGTGSDGRLFRVSANGQAALFTDFNELDVTALAVAPNGNLFAATSPDGKVYRVDTSGKAEVYFDPADKYIWSLTVLSDNSLIVGTGENGKIYRVKAANASADSSLLFDSSETHIISLATDKQGNVLAGTDASGIVLRISPEGRAFALLDAPAPLREIHEISVAADGSIYVLALSDSASASGTSASGGTISGTSASGATVTVVTTGTSSDEQNQQQTPPRSRNDLSAVKSAVFRIAPDGGNEILWSSTSVTGFALTANPNGDGVLLGTSDKGRIYGITNDARETLLLQTNEGQISTFKTRGNEILATSSNTGKVYGFNPTLPASEGAFESAVRDAKSSALWGRIWWTSPNNDGIALQTRTGNTEKPDATWSDWSAAYTNADGAQITSPAARFCQWRAILRSRGQGTTGAGQTQTNLQLTPVLNQVSVSYLPRNIAPEVLRVEVLPTNVGLQSNVAPQIDPNIENSGLDPTAFGLPPAQAIPPRRLYQRGARSLVWTAEDRNGDKLEYAVYYRAANEANFRLLKDKLRETFYTIDGAALSDGRYQFKIAASDRDSNAIGQDLSGERTSEFVDIDNTAPVVSIVGQPQIAGERVRVVFEAVDASNQAANAASGLRRAEVSLDNNDWQAARADDGISDSARERYTIEIPVAPGEHTVSLRVFDANGNAGSARANVRR